MKKLNSNHWLVILLALPMLLFSQKGSATDFVTTFSSVSEDAGLLQDVTGSQEAAWTYTTTSGETTIYYVDGGVKGLSFSLPFTSSASESLYMTSKRSFSGVLKTIKVSCPEIEGLVIYAYYMTQSGAGYYLGSLSYDDYDQAYTYSNIKTVDNLNDNYIKLEYCVSSSYSSEISNDKIPQINNGKQIEDYNNNINWGQTDNNQKPVNISYLSVYGLSGVTISINEPVEPQIINQPVSFDPSVFGSADLSNFLYKGILFTLNVSPDGDGFELEDGEGVIYLSTTKTDANVASLAGYVEGGMLIPGSNIYAQDYTGGITLMVPAGSGFLQIEAETEGDYVLHVKIGSRNPVEIASMTRKLFEIPYKVAKDTYVYIYLTQNPSASRQKTRIGKRAVAHSKIYSAKCASTPDVTSFVITIPDGKKLAMVSPYDLDFTSLESKGVKAYICTGYEVSTKKLWMTRVKDVPADTPILVKGAKGSYAVPVGTSSTYYPENFLFGNATSKATIDWTEGYVNYGVSQSTGAIGPIKTTVLEFGPGKAYFHVPTSVASKVSTGKVHFEMGKGGKLAMVSDYDLDFTQVEGLKAYTVTGFDNKKIIWLTRVMAASAGTPLLLRGTSEGKYDVSSAATQMAYVNMMDGNTSDADKTLTPEMDGSTIYVLSLGSGLFGPLGKEAKMTKGKAWLPVPTWFLEGVSTSRAMGDDTLEQESEVICLEVSDFGGLDDGTTCIRSIDVNQLTNDTWYNLNGQRIDKPNKKGLYILNGKKVIVR